MAKAKKEWKPDGYIKAQLRRIWRWSKRRRECLKSKTCLQCGKRGKLFADHVLPVVDPQEGFKDWNTYVARMFDGELQALCKKCHNAKTKEENKVRRLCHQSKKSANG